MVSKLFVRVNFILGVNFCFTLLNVNNSNSLKLNLLMFTVKIVE